MDDLISRQMAIDEIKEIYEWHDYVTEERIIEHFKRMPSAQPEIVRCRECKYHDGVRCFRWNSTIITGFDDFCSNGERRIENEET